MDCTIHPIPMEGCNKLCDTSATKRAQALQRGRRLYKYSCELRTKSVLRLPGAEMNPPQSAADAGPEVPTFAAAFPRCGVFASLVPLGPDTATRDGSPPLPGTVDEGTAPASAPLGAVPGVAAVNPRDPGGTTLPAATTGTALAPATAVLGAALAGTVVSSRDPDAAPPPTPISGGEIAPVAGAT